MGSSRSTRPDNIINYHPTDTGLADGRFVAAWTDIGAGNDQRTFAQLFGADGSKSGAEFLADTSTGPDGMDTLLSVEHLQFADATITPVDDGDPLFDTLY